MLKKFSTILAEESSASGIASTGASMGVTKRAMPQTITKFRYEQVPQDALKKDEKNFEVEHEKMQGKVKGFKKMMRKNAKERILTMTKGT